VTPDELQALTHRPTTGPFRSTVVVEGAEMATLADLPPARDRLLFVGRQPDPASVEAGHYQQGAHGRTFWRRLMLAGILPAGTEVATADEALVAAGHGITDLVKAPAGDLEATSTELTAGVGALWQKVAIWRPAAIVFLEQRVAAVAAGRPLTVTWGPLDGVALGGRPCFLMPDADASTEEVDEGLNFLRNLAASLPVDRA
jgi:G:T/U-mismatch repair DNA glycosylase